MSWSQMIRLYHKTVWFFGVTGAIAIYTTQQLMGYDFPTIWISVAVTVGVVATFVTTLIFMLTRSTRVIFIDMPDPNNYAAALLQANESKGTTNWLAVVGRWVLKRFGYPLCPLYIVCSGRRVNLGLAHKNTNNRFFDQSTKSWLKWDCHQHVGPLPADEAIMYDPQTVEDSVLVLKKNMFDLDCILQTAGCTDYVLVVGHIAKQIPLSYSHHADEWRFYNNVKKHWVTRSQYDQLSNKRCNTFDKTQNFDKRRKLARQIINQFTGLSDFESSSTGSHWLSLDQLHALLHKYATIDITMAGPATEMAYLVDKSSNWTQNVTKINTMWAVCELGPNTGKMNVCGINFNEAADVQDAQYVSPKHFPNAMFSFLPTETCKLTLTFRAIRNVLVRGLVVLQYLADKIVLWDHVSGGWNESLFDCLICEYLDISTKLQEFGLLKVFVIPNINKGYMILSPSTNETLFTAWVNPNEMFRVFSWGQKKIYFNGTHWANAKVVG